MSESDEIKEKRISHHNEKIILDQRPFVELVDPDRRDWVVIPNSISSRSGLLSGQGTDSRAKHFRESIGLSKISTWERRIDSSLQIVVAPYLDQNLNPVVVNAMGHIAWTPMNQPPTRYPKAILECVEDARVNIALSNIGVSGEPPDRGGALGAAVHGDLSALASDGSHPVNVLVKAICWIGTPQEKIALKVIDKIEPAEWKNLSNYWMNRISKDLEKSCIRSGSSIPSYSRVKVLARLLAKDIEDLLGSENEQEQPRIAELAEAAGNSGAVGMGAIGHDGESSEIGKGAGASNPKKPESQKVVFDDLGGKEKRKGSGALGNPGRIPGRFGGVKSEKFSKYDGLNRALRFTSIVNYKKTLGHIKKNTFRFAPDWAPAFSSFTFGPTRYRKKVDFTKSGVQVYRGACVSAFRNGFPPEFQEGTPNHRIAGYVVDEWAIEKGITSEWVRNKIFEESSLLPPNGIMTIKEPKREVRLDQASLFNSRKKRSSSYGYAVRRPDRTYIDQNIFNRFSNENRVTILLDGSGSMSLSVEDVEKMTIAAGGQATVAIYSGANLKGNLTILSKDSYRCTSRFFMDRQGGNEIDFEALEWLSKQPGKKIWVSDGYVCSEHFGPDKTRVEIGDQSVNVDYYSIKCTEVMIEHDIIRIENIAQAIVYFKDTVDHARELMQEVVEIAE